MWGSTRAERGDALSKRARVITQALNYLGQPERKLLVTREAEAAHTVRLHDSARARGAFEQRQRVYKRRWPPER